MLTNLRLENGVKRLFSGEGKGERNRQARNGLSLRKHAQNLELHVESNKKVPMCLNQGEDASRFSFSIKILLAILGFDSINSGYSQTSGELFFVIETRDDGVNGMALL